MKIKRPIYMIDPNNNIALWRWFIQ
jgi:hypothetical protein